MRVFDSPHQLKEAVNKAKKRQNECSVGFVPTMGALHQGHIELIRKAREQNDIVVVSIFVNPTQFLKNEDLEKYPNKMEADKKICEVSGVDFLFCPTAKEMYEKDEIRIHAPNIRGYILEGTSRPGHFNGVLSVVMKLFHIVTPVNAYFGKKDAQQLFLISLMVKQMFMDVNIIAVETKRDSDGLALSSRNSYLDQFERKQALKVSESLRKASNLVASGTLYVSEIHKEMLLILEPLEIAYIAFVDREFHALEKIELKNSIILVEVLVGTTRLLDNIWL
jgi:pantoate--beta-alanine ligase